MATAIPVTGSFTEYAQRFVDDSLAFGLGWAYWYLWVTVRPLSSSITHRPSIWLEPLAAHAKVGGVANGAAQVLANEYNAVSLVIMYWTDAVPQWAWILIFWFLFLGLSNFGVREYGEMEFWLSLYVPPHLLLQPALSKSFDIRNLQFI
jgi:amino acid transporter